MEDMKLPTAAEVDAILSTIKEEERQALFEELHNNLSWYLSARLSSANTLALGILAGLKIAEQRQAKEMERMRIKQPLLAELLDGYRYPVLSKNKP